MWLITKNNHKDYTVREKDFLKMGIAIYTTVKQG